MIDSSASQRFSEVSGTGVGLVRVTCSLNYFRDELYFLCIYRHCYIAFVTLCNCTYPLPGASGSSGLQNARGQWCR